MKDDTNNPTKIKEYLIEKNKDLILMKFPGIPTISDKVEMIADNLKDQSIEQKRNKKGDFLKEVQKDKEISLEERGINHLKDIVNILKTMQDDSSISINEKEKEDKADLGFLAGLRGDGIKKFAKGALKGLGKIALPLALLFGAAEFAEGFGNALEITGREDFSAKLQGGLSQIISSLTFGLIDPKTISKKMDEFLYKIFDFFLDPIQTLRKFSEDFITIDSISRIIDTLSFGLIPEGVIKDGLTKIKTLIEKTIFTPIIKFQELWNWWVNDFNITEYVESALEPLNKLKDAIFSGDVFKPLTDWFDKFDLIEFLGIAPLLKKVKDFKNNMIEILQSPKKLIMDFIGLDKEEVKPKVHRYKITPIEKKNETPSNFSNAIKESYMMGKLSNRKEVPSENNNLNIVNNTNNNNIIMDDLSVSTDDYESLAYSY